MKLHLFYLGLAIAASLFATSCAENEMGAIEPEKSAKPYIRTPEDALRIANEAALMLDSISTRATSRYAKSLQSVQTIKKSMTRSAGSNISSDTIMYIVNYENEQGFAVVSANMETVDLLALTENGSYYTFENGEVEGFDFFMEMAEEYVMNDLESILEPILPPWDDDTTELFSPITIIYDNICWGQRFPAGKYCPNGVCGCGPLINAEIMSFYRFPTSITLTYPGTDISVQPLDWSSIRMHKLTAPNANGQVASFCTQSIYCTASDSSHNALGRLCRQLGYMMNCYYGSGSFFEPVTSTDQDEIIPNFTSLGYNCTPWTPYTTQCTRTHLSNDHPVYMTGDRTSVDGHYWIVTGFMERSYMMGGQLIGENGTLVRKYYNHIDWGWDGRFNGYFYDGIFAVGNCLRRDTTPYNLSDYPDHQGYNYQFNVEYMVPTPASH